MEEEAEEESSEAGEEDNWNEEDEKSSAKSIDEAPKSATSEPEEGSPSSPSNASPKIEALQTVIKIEPGTECPAPTDRMDVCESVIKKAGSVNDLDTISGATSPAASAVPVTKTTSPPIIKTEPLASPVPSVPTPNEQDQYVGIQPPALQSALTGTRYYPTVINAASDSRYRPESSDTRQGYLCPPCGIRFSSFSTLEAHQTFYCSHRLKKNSKGGTESEGEEGRASSVPGGYDQDEGSSGENMSTGEPSSKAAKTGKQYRCTHCSYSADKKVSLNRHMRMHSVSPATSIQNDSDSSVPPVDRYCQECDIRFSNLKTFRAHKMHYCSTRNVIKRPPNANNTSPSSNVSVDSRISPPLPFGLPNQSSAQPFVALPTNPVLIIPYAIIQGGSMLSGSVTSNLSTQDGVYILLQDGSIQMVAQGIPSQPPRLPEASSPVLQPLLTANNNQVRKENISPKASKPVPTIPLANGALDLRTRRESHGSESTTTIDASEEEKENRLIDEHTDHEDIVCAPSIPLILSTSSTCSTPSPIPLSPESQSLSSASLRSDRRLCSPSPKSLSVISKTSTTSKKVTNGVIQKCAVPSKILANDTLHLDDRKAELLSSQSAVTPNTSSTASPLDRSPNYTLTEMLLAAAAQNPETLKELQFSSTDMLPHLSALQHINAAAAVAAAAAPNASGKRPALNPIANIPLLLPPVSPGSRVLPELINPSILPLLTSELALRLGTANVQPGMQQYVRQGSWKCEDCSISFCKYENYVAHKKHYCSTRKVQESTQQSDDNNSKTSPIGSPSSKTTPSPQSSLAKENTSPIPQPINVIQNARQYSQFICTMCGIKFTSLDNLTTHQTFYCPNRLAIPDGEKSSLKCPKCKMLLPADQLPNHQCTSASLPNWKCPSCFVVCTSTNAIQKHVESHTGVKGFLCTICNYKGGTIRGMRTHIRVHFDKRNGDIMEENFITYIMDDTVSNASSVTDENSSDKVLPKKSPPERVPSASPSSRDEKMVVDGNRSSPILVEHIEDEDEYIEVDELPNIVKQEVKTEPPDLSKAESKSPSPPSTSQPSQQSEVIVVDDSSTSNNNNNNSISNNNKKFGSKYCKSCDISFNYLSTFIAHKKYYCSSHSSNPSSSSSSPPPPSTTPLNGTESIVVPTNLPTAAHIV